MSNKTEGPDGQDPSGEMRSAEASWYDERTLRLIRGANRELLELLAGSSARNRSHPIAEVSVAIDVNTIERIARCPFLLMDAGFRDLQRWSSIQNHRLPRPQEPPRDWLSKDIGVPFARRVLTVAWHVVGAHPEASLPLIGASPECARVIAELDVQTVETVAEQHWDWVRPRWETRPDLWHRLIARAAEGDTPPFTTALQGLQWFLGDLLDIP